MLDLLMNIKNMDHHYINYATATPEEKTKCLAFLRDEFTNSDDPAHLNMWREGWQERPETLPYILEKTDRFSKAGEFLFLSIDNTIVACSGVYRSYFSDHIYIAGVRMWVNKHYRNMLIPKNFLLVKNKEFAVKNNAKIVALTFNEYNKNLIKVFKRARIGEQVDKKFNRSKSHMFYGEIREVPFPVKIQYTKQWVAYELLDDTFEYDWGNIKYE